MHVVQTYTCTLCVEFCFLCSWKVHAVQQYYLYIVQVHPCVCVCLCVSILDKAFVAVGHMGVFGHMEWKPLYMCMVTKSYVKYIYIYIYLYIYNMYIFYVIRGVQAEDLYGHAWWCQCQKYLLLVEFFTHSVPGSRTYSKSVLAGSGCTHLFLEIHTGSCVSLLSLSPNEPPWCRWLSTTLMPKECADPRGTSIGSVKARSDLSCMCCLTVYYADAYMMCRSHNIYIYTLNVCIF